MQKPAAGSDSQLRILTATRLIALVPPCRRQRRKPQEDKTMNRIIRKDEAAVSPVIATILMVAITVVLATMRMRSEEHTSELQSRSDLVCRLLLEKKKKEVRQQRNVSFVHTLDLQLPSDISRLGPCPRAYIVSSISLSPSSTHLTSFNYVTATDVH